MRAGVNMRGRTEVVNMMASRLGLSQRSGVKWTDPGTLSGVFTFDTQAPVVTAMKVFLADTGTADTRMSP